LKGKFKLKANWEGNVPNDLKSVILGATKDKWTTIFRNPAGNQPSGKDSAVRDSSESVLKLLSDQDTDDGAQLKTSKEMSETDKKLLIAKYEYHTEMLRSQSLKRKMR
jgi:hypothetical protein